MNFNRPRIRKEQKKLTKKDKNKNKKELEKKIKKNCPPKRLEIKNFTIKNKFYFMKAKADKTNSLFSSRQEFIKRKTEGLNKINQPVIFTRNKIKNINKIEMISLNDYELNSLNYKKALKYDKRNYKQYYYSLIRTKQLLIFTFYTHNDYNSKIIKISLFFFYFSLYFTVNALFFDDSTMHEIYINQGNFAFIYQIPISIYSSLVCAMLNFIIKNLSLSEKNIIELKNMKNIRKKTVQVALRCIKIELLFFFLSKFILLIFFWYYISCFCAVYKNTQIHLIKDTLLSFGLLMLYPFALSLLPGILRIPSLRTKKADRKCLYITSKVIQLL